MQRVGQFEKVSFNEFKKSMKNSIFHITNIEEIYNNIELPQRKTKGSAGYDFFLPIAISLNQNQTITIPTGIRVKIKEGWFLSIFPRSSLGFKYRLQLDNTVGIIDSDYYNTDNEGHIFIKFTNDNKENKILSLNLGDSFMQGIFLQYGVTYDDNVETNRVGGIGSTN